MRYVIKSEKKGYFTEMQVTSSREVTLNGVVIGKESIYAPIFPAFTPNQAIHFDTEADATEVMAKNPSHHGGPEAFSGCSVEPTET